MKKNVLRTRRLISIRDWEILMGFETGSKLDLTRLKSNFPGKMTWKDQDLNS